jgi:fucose permease
MTLGPTRGLTRPVVALMDASFFLMGVVGGMVGPLVPFLRTDLHLSYSQAGLVFSAQSAGSLALLVVGGWLLQRLGKRVLMVVGTLALAGGLLATALATDFWWVLAGNVLVGVGVSLQDIVVSTLCIEGNRDGKGKALNLLHGFFGAGAVAGPLVALALGPLVGGWRWAFGLVGLAPLGLALGALLVRLPAEPPAATGSTDAGSAPVSVYRRPFLWLGAFALFVYCGVEWGVGAWLPSYWTAIPGARNLDPAWATSAFWLTFTVGRFVVGPWADAWGFERFLTRSIAATLVVVGLWIVFPQPAWALVWVGAFGFIIAGQYPTFAALISHRFPGAAGPVTSLLSVFASLGTFFWPPAVGAWADARGIEGLPWVQLVLTVFLALAAAAAFVAARRTRD